MPQYPARHNLHLDLDKHEAIGLSDNIPPANSDNILNSYLAV